MSWRSHLPDDLGALPFNGRLTRTEPGGPIDAPIVVLGVYPAVTATKVWTHPDGRRMSLPVAVERTSFAPASASGKEIDARYLAPLQLSRDQVLFVDVWPYYFASSSKTGPHKRSMWDNVKAYASSTNEALAVEERPRPDALLGRASSSAANVLRMRELLGAAPRRTLITLGNEAAAFARGIARESEAQRFLYAEPEERDVFGARVHVHHVAHPGILMKKREPWVTRHRDWCARFRGRL